MLHGESDFSRGGRDQPLVEVSEPLTIPCPATSHIGWYLWTRDEENLKLLTDGLRGRLSQGPVLSN